MPAEDRIKPMVVAALVKDGWTITDDPLTIEYEDTYFYIDLGGERAVAASSGNELVAIEVKSFAHRSLVHNLHEAVGQFIVYRTALEHQGLGRELYLGVSKTVYDQVFTSGLVELVVRRIRIPPLVVDVEREAVAAWLK